MNEPPLSHLPSLPTHTHTYTHTHTLSLSLTHFLLLLLSKASQSQDQDLIPFFPHAHVIGHPENQNM